MGTSMNTMDIAPGQGFATDRSYGPGIMTVSARAICIAVILILTGCGGGGNTDPAGGGSSGSSGGSTPPAGGGGTSGSGIGGSAAGAHVVETCPAAASTGVPINTSLHAGFDKEIDASTVTRDAIIVTCDNQVIPGASTSHGTQILFTPDNPISADKTCLAQVSATLRDVTGTPISTTSWTFHTGTTESRSFAFTDTNSTTGFGTSIGLGTRMASEGSKVVVIWRNANVLHVMASADSGKTYSMAAQLSMPREYGAVEDMDVTLVNGVAYIVWRTLPPFVVGGMIWHSHSIGDLGVYSSPLLLNYAHDQQGPVEPVIATNGNGSVHVIWNEVCGRECGDHSQIGVHLASSQDGGDTFDIPVMIAGDQALLSRIAWVKDHFMVTWAEGADLKLFDLGSPLNLRATLSGGSDQIWPYSLIVKNDGSLFVHWPQGPAGDQRYYLARYSSSAGTVVMQRELIRNSASASSICSKIASDSNGKLYWMVGTSNPTLTMVGYGGLVNRELYVSDDAGKTFYDPQSLDFMGPSYRPFPPFYYGDTDEQCPSITLTSDDKIAVTWEHSSVTDRHVYYNQGAPIVPCGL